jgi:hypothetical protein
MAADAKRNFADVTDVVIVADNESSVTASFNSICNQIRTAGDEGLGHSERGRG